MSIISRTLKQICVHWSTNGLDKFGQPLFSDPVERACRWVDKTVEIIDKAGVKSRSQTQILFEDCPVKVGDFLRLGKLDSVTDVACPLRNTGTWEILQVDRVPSYDGSYKVLKAYL